VLGSRKKSEHSIGGLAVHLKVGFMERLRDYSHIYRFIANMLDDVPGGSGDDVQTWLHGATQANAGQGAYSAMIRAYSAQQMVLRGVEYSDELMQLASNKVAERALEDILRTDRIQPDGTWLFPTIHELAERDATGVGEVLFAELPFGDSARDPLIGGGINAGWAGTILFSGLNSDQTRRLISAGDNQQVDRLDDLKNLLFAYDAYRAGFEAALFSALDSLTSFQSFFDQFLPDVGILIETFWGARNNPDALRALISKSLTYMLPDEVKPFGELIEQVGLVRVLGMIRGTTQGQVVESTEEVMFTLIAQSFFASYGTAQLQAASVQLLPGDPSALAELARTDISARAALAALSVIRVPVEFSAGQRLSLYNEQTGTGKITDEWITDRSNMLAGLITKWTISENQQVTDYAAKDGFDYKDLSSGQEVLVLPDPFVAIQPLVHRVYFGGDDANMLEGQIGNDRLYGMGGNDNLKGEAGDDYLEGGTGHDKLDGGADRDILLGMSGNDTLIGGQGNDILNGGIGNDRYEFTDGDGFDRIIDIDGLGLLRVNGQPIQAGKQVAPNANAWRSEDGQTLFTLSDMSNGRKTLLISYGVSDRILIENYTPCALGLVLHEYVETTPVKPVVGDNVFTHNTASDGVLGQAHYINQQDGSITVQDYHVEDSFERRNESASKFDDLGNSLDQSYLNNQSFVINELDQFFAVTFEGGNLNDSLFGSLVTDEISGMAGDDYIDGRGSGDVLSGGEGSDHILGGSGRDTILAEKYDSKDSGGNSDDFVDAGDGDDQVSGGGGDDEILGGLGADSLTGGAGKDRVFGGSEDDWIFGDGYLVEDDKQNTWWTDFSIRMQVDFSGEKSTYNDYLDGGDGNDWISAEAGSDIIVGGAGDDRLSGDRELRENYALKSNQLVIDYVSLPDAMHGDDTIYAGIGNDYAIGGGGHDVIYGGSDNDTLYGDLEDGNDTVFAGNDMLFGEAGNDTLVSGGGDDYLDGGLDNDLLIGGKGADTLIGGSGNDELQGGDDNDHLSGSEGMDTLAGQDGDDELDGGADSDTLIGGKGHDSLHGGSGDDQILGDDISGAASGDDSLYGDSGNDSIWGGAGNDLLDGGADNDNLVGEQGNDSLVGGAGNDDLHGLDGNDRLIGGAGLDYLSGGADNDTYVFNLGDSPTVNGFGESIQDNEGKNTIEFGAGISLAHISLSQYSDGVVRLQYSDRDSINLLDGLSGGVSKLQFADGTSADLQDIYANQTEDEIDLNSTMVGANLIGSASSNQLVATGGSSTFRGGRGDDVLTGGGGGNTYRYSRGDGVDHIYDTGGHLQHDGTPAANRILFGADIRKEDITLSLASSTTLLVLIAGNPSGRINIHNFNNANAAESKIIGYFDFHDGSSLSYEELLGGGFKVSGGSGSDILQGSNLDDFIVGNASSDTLSGDMGQDTLVGGEGDDSLVGGGGADIYYYAKGDGRDTLIEVDDGSINKLRFAADIGVDDVELSARNTDLLLTVKETGETLTLSGWLVPGTSLLQQVEFSDGSVWTESSIRQSLRTTRGTAADDTLTSLPGETAILYGLAGNDTLKGDTHADVLYGGDGDDVLFGNGENDTLWGDDGNDTLQGGNGDDLLYGGEGNDFINTGAGNDIVYAGAGRDNIVGGDGSVIYAGVGADSISVSGGQAVLRCEVGDGADKLYDFVRVEFSEALHSSSFSYLRSGSHLAMINKVDASDSIYIWGFYYDSPSVNTKKDSYFSLNFIGESALSDIPEQSLSGVYLDAREISDDVYWRDVKYYDTTYSPNADKFGQYGHVSGGGYFLGDSAVGNDILIGASSSDVFIVRGGDDRISGLEGNDKFTIYDGNDTVSGGRGDDLVTIRGMGNKTVLYSRGDGRDTLDVWYSEAPLEPLISVMIDGYSLDDLSFSRSGDDAVIILGDGSDSITLQSFLKFYDQSFSTDYILKLPGGIVLSSQDIYDQIVASESAPLTQLDVIYAPGDSPLSIFAEDFLINDSDAESVINYASGLHVSGVSNPLNCQVVFDSFSGSVIFVPDSGFTGLASFEYTASDYIKTSQGRVDVYVSKAYEVIQGVPLVITSQSLLSNDLDASNDAYQIISVTSVDGLSVDFDEVSNTITVTDAGSYLGQAKFEYIVSDGVTTKIETAFLQVGTTQNQSIGGTNYHDYLEGSFGNDTLSGSAGNDTLLAGKGNDRLNGGSGADIMVGDQGNDTYVLDNPGDLVIEGQNSGVDTIETSISLALSANIENLLLTGSSAINGTGNELDNVLTGNSGTNTLIGGSGNDRLDGKAGVDTMLGGLGNDTYVVERTTDVVTELAGEGTDTIESSVTLTLGNNVENLTLTGTAALNGTGNALDNTLIGNSGKNILTGGAGNDQLFGGIGDDKYVYKLGDGVDTIDNTGGGNDGVFFSGGIDEERLTFTRDGDDLLILVDGDAEQSVRVLGHFLGDDKAISYVQSDGGFLINASRIAQIVAAGNVPGGFDTLVEGTAAGEQLAGGQERDLVRGLAGNDTLFGMGGNDQIEGGDGNDYLSGGNGSQSGSGDDILIGGMGNDVLDGEDGDDQLTGGAGDDKYYYRANGGVDVIDNTGGGFDGAFFIGIARTRLSFHREGDDLLILVDGNLEQQVKVTDHFLGGDFAIDYVQPDGGSYITTAQIAGLLTALPDGGTGEPGDGGNPGDGGQPGDGGTNPGGGDQPPVAGVGGDDVLTGTAANDVLIGGAGKDTLNGGAGNDRLLGGVGDDTYVYTAGQDVLEELGGIDTLRFANGITFNQVASGLGKSGNDLVLKVNGSTANQVTLKDFFLGGDNLVETISFETGGQLTASQIFGAFGLPVPTAPAAAFDSVVQGTSGNDAALNGTAQRDLLQGFNGNDQLSGAAGNDRLEGGNGNDTLNGGAGNDTQVGGRGDDTYVFAAGGGQDVIDNIGGGFDTLRFEGIAFNQVSSGLMKSGNDLVLKVSGGSDQVTLKNWFLGGDHVVDVISFASGGQLTAAQLFGAFGLTNPDVAGSPNYQGMPDERSFGTILAGQAGDQNIIGSSDADLIDGGAGNDKLRGGKGNDYLLGGDGSDTYYFAAGDGQDTINNLSNTPADNDILSIEGITRDNLWLSRQGDSLVIDVRGSEDSVTVQDWYANSAQRLDAVQAGGSTLYANQVDNLVSAMAAFGAPAGGEINLSQVQRDQLNAVIAANWQ
jgi:Ca2+-binding RTX toxin-like protein